MSYFNGAKLRDLRVAKRMSMSQMHKRTGISKAQISLIENGRVDPRMSTVVRILSCLDASLADLEPGSPEVITIDEVVELKHKSD